jgi:hypothetical protein
MSLIGTSGRSLNQYVLIYRDDSGRMSFKKYADYGPLLYVLYVFKEGLMYYEVSL